MNKKSELKKKIMEEGNIHIFMHKGIMGLIMRPKLVRKVYNNWRTEYIYWCGYALIPAKSKLGECVLMHRSDIIDNIDVHGGITLFEEDNGIIWVGFDTAHLGDVFSLDDATDNNRTYRDKDYVMKETKRLIDEILKLCYNINIKVIGGDA